MRSVRLTAALVLSAAIVVLGGIRASPCAAQTRLASLEELRRELGNGDAITVAAPDGELVAGRLMRIGTDDLEIRLRDRHGSRDRRPRTVTVPFDRIKWLERRRDSPRNGLAIGAAIGTAIGAGMFLYATAIDRNEIDEWGPLYASATAIFTGVGALVGWRIDAAISKPHIRFDGAAGGRHSVGIRPLYSRQCGLGVVVSFSP
jgi:hypothetical protein